MATTLKRSPRTIEQPQDGAWGMPAGQNLPATQSPPWDEPQQDEQTETDRVMQLMRGVSGMDRASVKVYKVDNGVSAFCDNYQPSEFEDGDYSKIRDAYGAGKYKIMLYGIHPETGNFGLLARENVTLMQSSKPRENPIQPQQNDAIAQVLQSLVENQRQTNEAIMTLKSAPPVDPMAQMSQMLSMMTMMRSAMGLDQQQKTGGLSEIIASIKELRGVASEIIPERSEEPSMLSMLPQALEVIKAGMQNQATQQPVQIPNVALPQNVQPNPIQQPVQQSEEDMKLSQMIQLKQNLSKLLTMAREKKSPDEGAKLVYEELPDEFIEILDDEKWFDMLALIDSEIKTHAEWFTAARNGAIKLFDSESDTQNLPPAR